MTVVINTTLVLDCVFRNKDSCIIFDQDKTCENCIRDTLLNIGSHVKIIDLIMLEE